MKRLIALLFIFLPAVPIHADNAIEVDGGAISGVAVDGVQSFKGIPYAAPPVGELRWKAPQPVLPWDGIRECSEFSKVCPQKPYPAASVYNLPNEPQSEDCLYLNVWTPEQRPDEKLPVMVWIHGGAWTRGSGSTFIYDGTALANKGVVLVTINYRLGPFGFFAYPELSAESEHGVSGNQGILDAIAALEWVQRNITKFGGDADRVTIFGESAGSWSVNVLQATPMAKGLFHRAIGQSGTRFGAAPQLANAESEGKSAHDAGLALAKECEVSSLKELRDLPADKLVNAKFRTIHTIDGHVFPTSVAKIYAAGQQNQVPVIVGSNADEMTSLSVPAMVPKTVEAVTRVLTGRMGAAATEKFKEVYNVTDDASAMRAFLHIGGDTSFASGMRKWARYSDQAGTDSYLYYFTHSPPGPASDYLGAYHAAEIAYAFGNVQSNPRVPFDADDRKLSDIVAGYWVNFAATGDPNGDGLPEWPEYNPNDEGYIELDESVEAKHHLLKARLDFLESLTAGQ